MTILQSTLCLIIQINLYILIFQFDRKIVMFLPRFVEYIKNLPNTGGGSISLTTIFEPI